jgi:hypothetical protein
MRERNQETGLEYADVDLFGLRMRRGREHVPSWKGAWIHCLKNNDEESAHLIRLRNDEDYREDYEQRQSAWFQHQPLKSLREVQSERDAEMEDAAA